MWPRRPPPATRSICRRCWCFPSRIPPHRAVQPLASPFHRFAMAALAVSGVAGLARQRRRIAARRTVLHGGNAGPAARARVRPRRRFSSSPAPTPLRILRPGSGIPRSSTSRTSSWSRVPVTGSTSCGRGCRRSPIGCGARGGPCAGGRSDVDLPAPGADAGRFVDRRPRPAAARRADRRPGAAARRNPHPQTPLVLHEVGKSVAWPKPARPRNGVLPPRAGD